MTQPETVAIHAGQTIDPTTHALAVPIYQTVAYGFDDAEHAANLFALKTPGNIYTRLMNPTTSVLEERVAALEGGVGALATSSGAASITYAVLNLARTGDNIVSVSTLYGGTYALFANTLAQFGIEARFVSPDDAAVLDGVVDEGTRLVFCESIGNPALNIIDLGRLRFGHGCGRDLEHSPEHLLEHRHVVRRGLRLLAGEGTFDISLK